MNLTEAKEQFIQTWGTLGTNWGINRTMAQIHALLLISAEAMSTEAIMEKLNISRGNTNMNIRELIAWGLLRRELKAGDRKEYFSAQKDMWEVAQCIIRERKKRELDPVRKAIDALSKTPGNKRDTDYTAFMAVVAEMQELTGNADKVLNKFAQVEKNWFIRKFLKLFV